MKTQLLPMNRLSQAMMLAGLVTVAAPVSAVEYWLRADTVNVTMPDGVTVPMWGYALTDSTFAPGTATVPGPALAVPPGDPVLTIHLQNNLPVATSIVIPGQVAAMTPVWDNDMSGARPSATARVRSFTHEALVGGGTADYTWTNVKPGTYLYHSGTHPQVQMQMGLYGGVTRNAVAATGTTPAEAYAGVPYNNEVTLLFSEIDPALHAAVASGAYGTAAGPTSTLDYKPKYFLINGKPYAAGDPSVGKLPAGQKTLLRFLNAGLQTHVPVINGQYLQMIAEDGNPYPWSGNPRQQYSVLLPAAKTVDAILTPQLAASPVSNRYPIYDRRLNLNNAAAQDGGMLAILGDSIPAITSTPTLTATQGLSYAYKVTVSDPDGGPITFTLDQAPAGMTINTTSDYIAWIGWRPTNAQVGTQAVTVRATDPTGLSTTQSFNIAVANVNDAPLARNDAYTMIKGGTLNVAAPGVLANDSDPDVGDTLTATNFGTPKAGTLTGNADGSFSYTPQPTYTGMDSFAYLARDSFGLASKAPGWVTISVRANRAPVTVDDTVSTLPNTPLTIPVSTVLGNDSDPDTVIDPTNHIDPATVFIPLTGKPNMGGTVVVNADGTITYTPMLNFTGTEVFTYAVKDTYITPAISKAAYVRVNVQ